MQRVRISSDAIASLGYHASTRTLEVEFHSGAVYQYLHVPPVEFDRLVHAESRGEYVNTHIKPRYEYVCVQPAQHQPT